MPAARRCILLVAAALVGTAAPAQATRLLMQPGRTGDYFVDFRARDGGVFGHTYVVYGRLGPGGREFDTHTAGLYPHGEFSDTVLLAVLVMPGIVGTEPADRNRPPTVIYRRRLDAAAYARIAGTVQGLRIRSPAWDLLLFNCNNFAARVARSIGLAVPPALEIPRDFVRDLWRMNAPQRLR